MVCGATTHPDGTQPRHIPWGYKHSTGCIKVGRQQQPHTPRPTAHQAQPLRARLCRKAVRLSLACRQDEAQPAPRHQERPHAAREVTVRQPLHWGAGGFD